MSDREHSPAYAALPQSARRVFAAIERAIGDGSSASVSYADFGLDYHISRGSISSSLKLLDHLGLIDIEPGRRLVNVFRLSRRWCTIDEVEAKRLSALAHELKPPRASSKPVPPKPVKPRPERQARPRTMQRATPSLPRLRCLEAGDGR